MTSPGASSKFPASPCMIRRSVDDEELASVSTAPDDVNVREVALEALGLPKPTRASAWSSVSRPLMKGTAPPAGLLPGDPPKTNACSFW